MILGTAGHIDHGKTALVAALTGVDTDRLKEEKARGITIELGFAELSSDDGRSMGVVDVPGHEGFVRTMVAGATGMDVVLLVVAADEGVMPQTREHLAILRLLSVPSLVVALTKSDLADEEWLALVDDDVRELLADTPYAAAPRLPVSAQTGEGLDMLREALFTAAATSDQDRSGDLARLPVDRVFTVQGTGTVVTGTLWTGTLKVDQKVRLLPGGAEARIRGLQVHGRGTESAGSGDRTAVALVGAGADRGELHRGRWMVADPAWQESWMLTVHVGLLADTAWSLEHNQRVRVHLGTSEVLARVALLEASPLGPGEEGWIQLRLEEPVVARGRDRVVLRSYSPMTTVGGGVVAEAAPKKRRRLTDAERDDLTALALDEPQEALLALLRITGWEGIPREALPVLLGHPPAVCARLLGAQDGDKGPGLLDVGGTIFGPDIVDEGARQMEAALEREHAADGLRGEIPLAVLRQSVPDWAHARLADGLLEYLAAEGRLELVGGGARRKGFTPVATPDQEAACRDLEAIFQAAGLASPAVEDLPEALRDRDDIWSLLRHMEGQGVLATIADGVYLHAPTLESAMAEVRSQFGGQSGLGPAEFRDVLGVTRKHLIPLLNYFDGIGLTVREDGERRVNPA